MLGLIDKFKARYGKIILTRNPSHGLVKANEDIIHPRSPYWDALVKESDWPPKRAAKSFLPDRVRSM